MISLAFPSSNRLITHVRAMINTHCFARVRYTNPLTKFAMAAHVSAKHHFHRKKAPGQYIECIIVSIMIAK